APDSPAGKREAGMPLIAKPFTPAQLAKRLAALLAKSGHMPTLLVVEDEPLVRMVLVDDLKALGYQVSDAGRAESALAKARAESVDAACIDLGLPDRRGDVLLDELRALAPALPGLIASGDARAPESLKGDPRLRLVAKPYTIDQIEAALRALGIAEPQDA